jgi:hypothetical protein
VEICGHHRQQHPLEEDEEGKCSIVGNGKAWWKEQNEVVGKVRKRREDRASPEVRR